MLSDRFEARNILQIFIHFLKSCFFCALRIEECVVDNDELLEQHSGRFYINESLGKNEFVRICELNQ